MFLSFLKHVNLLNFFIESVNKIYHCVCGVLFHSFRFACILMTLSLVIWCCYEFSKDEDVCEVLFKAFHQDEDSIYPDLIFGLPNRFDGTALRTYNESFNENNYRDFLLGGDGRGNWDDKMLDIDFDKVSMRIKDYVVQTCFYATLKDREDGNCEDHIVMHQHNNFDYAVATLRFPTHVPMRLARIKLKRSIFQSGVRPVFREFYVHFAYPNQFYRSFSSIKYQWPIRTNESPNNYVMRINLKSMEVLRKRKKKDNDCYNLKDFDGIIRERIIEKLDADQVCGIQTEASHCVQQEHLFKKS